MSIVSATDFIPLAPELFLLGATCLLLLIDLFVSDQRRGLTHFLSILILVGAAVLTLRQGIADAVGVRAFGGMFIRDGMADTLKLFVYLVTGGAFIYAKPFLIDRGLFKGEFYVLCLFAVLGMMVLISAGNLVTVYLGLELLALSSYALVAMDRDNRLASEAAMKYFVLGALASGMLLYGLSMVYGATGSLDISQIHVAAAALDGDRTLLLFGLVFVVVGVAFKFGAAPFHMWVPDVYHGAPSAVALFVSAAPKLGSFALAYRLFVSGLGGVSDTWIQMLAIVAGLSMVAGNLIAIAQTNLKRMLA
ncbi:MAG: NADH-quinone oxidoreductase subunit N, partial [Xanthomonadales bacterium]|nr:NADH-quinone oxidoreductase subunit N [Xanthomonadales bacterium]